jgi:dipicolinate synthase subunit A
VELPSRVGEFDIIFNTIPSLIFDKDMLKRTKKDALIIDLASRPGGVDFDAAAELGVRVIWALSLPGKVAPVTSGTIIKDTIMNVINELG